MDAFALVPINMPPICTSTHCVQCHFAPSVVCTFLKAEQLLTPPRMVWNMIFPHKSYGKILDNWHLITEVSGDAPQHPVFLVAKPKGEVTHLSQQGYNLCDTLGWTTQVYSDVQVCWS